MEECKHPVFEENPISAEDQLTLARSYAKGKERDQDYAKAAYWYEKAAKQGNPDAANYLGVLYAKGWGVEKDPVRAASLYLQAAEAGHIMGAKNLADCYRQGKGIDKDYTRAACWYEKAAAAGNSKAAVQLGLLYARGNGTEQDYSQAAVYYQQAADEGNTDAMNYLGILYEFGRGVEKKPSRATELYKQAADAGHARAACNLGNCYHDGRGVTQNYAQAAFWYEKAASGGISDALNSLAQLYDSGQGVPLDEAKAAALYQKAAEQGHAIAAYNLALCYEQGSGRGQDPDTAIFWYEKAIALKLDAEDLAETEYKIACCYLRIDMPGAPDTEQGMRWLNQAAAHNYPKAQALLDRLTPAKPAGNSPIPPAPATIQSMPAPTIPKKEKKLHPPLSRLAILACVFLVGLVVCGILGNLLNGQWVWYSHGEYSRLYTFFFLNLPNALATIIGLPLSGGVGTLFTLGSSLFFLVLSVMLYLDCKDGGDLPDIVHLICCFSFFQMISTVMATNQAATLYIAKHSFSFLSILAFVIFVVLDQSFSDSKSEKFTSLCRILASLGFALGTAGFSHLILNTQLNDLVIFPISASHLWTGIAGLCGNTIFGAVIMLLLQCIFATIFGLSLKTLLTGTREDSLFGLPGGSIIYIIFLFYYLYGWFNGFFDPRCTVLWVFLIVSIAMQTYLSHKQSRRHSILTLIGSIGTISMPLICLDALESFSPGIQYNIGRFSDLLSPLSGKLTALLVNILNSHQLATLIMGAVLLILFILFCIILYAPLITSKGGVHSIPGDPRLIMICSWVFLIGYLLICCLQGIYPYLGYYLCILPVMIFAACFTICLLQSDRDGVSWHIKGMAATLILAVLITLFAPVMLVLMTTVLCIALGIGVLIFSASYISQPRTKTDVKLDRIANALLGASVAADIASDYEQGKLSKQEAINLANITLPIFGNKDRKLKEELEQMDHPERN